MRDAPTRAWQGRLQALWARRPGQDARARAAAFAVARRIGPALAAARPDLTAKMETIGPRGRPVWDMLAIAWDLDGIPRLDRRPVSAHLCLALTEALRLDPPIRAALVLHGPPVGTLHGPGPWTLWIGDARHRPHDSPIGPQWLSGPPPHSRDGTEIRIGVDGAILPSP